GTGPWTGVQPSGMRANSGHSECCSSSLTRTRKVFWVSSKGLVMVAPSCGSVVGEDFLPGLEGGFFCEGGEVGLDPVCTPAFHQAHEPDRVHSLVEQALGVGDLLGRYAQGFGHVFQDEVGCQFLLHAGVVLLGKGSGGEL